MNKPRINILISIALLVLVLLSVNVLSRVKIEASQKNPTLTNEQKKAKEEKKQKVDEVLAEATSDIISTFKIDKNSYIKVELSEMPNFSKGKFQDFTDISFCQKATKIINSEIHSSPIGSLEPAILLNRKELIFAYKDKDGMNFMKKYEFKNSTFEKVSDNSTNGKQIVID
jgi:hypothetical protein